MNKDYPYYVFTDRLRRLTDAVQALFLTSPSRAYCHHTLRASNFAYQIAESESADIEAIVAATLVHDIGMTRDPSFLGHCVATRDMAPQLLREAGFDESRVLPITEIAAAHHPSPDESFADVQKQMVFDADCLDIVGIFGFLRWFDGIPDNLSPLESSAAMFVDILESANRSRGGLFYTQLGRQLGEYPAIECAKLCRALVSFVQSARAGASDLSPLSFSAVLSPDGKTCPKPGAEL